MTAQLKAALQELREARENWLVARYSILAGRQLAANSRKERAIDAVLAAAEAEERER